MFSLFEKQTSGVPEVREVPSNDSYTISTSTCTIRLPARRTLYFGLESRASDIECIPSVLGFHLQRILISFPCGTLGPVVKILVILLWESESQHLRRENLPVL